MESESVKIPAIFKPLLCERYRYKLFHGGRAGGKSYAIADSLLLKARADGLFIACVREVQDSIKDSVYKLLKDRAEIHGFSDFVFFESRVENTVTGSKIIFKGLKDQNAQNIKSLEGVDICWIEEGQSITKNSWEVLDPTIRKPNAEIWISMNREEENDPIWRALASNPDERTLVCRVNYTDNPFCPDDMKYLAEKCKAERPDDFAHIWLGEPIRQGNKRLIGSADVRKAFEHTMENSTSPLVIGLDIARFGDDKTVFCFRKGRMVVKFEEYAKKSLVEIANITTNIIQLMSPARIFLDIGGIGAGVYDILIDRGFAEIVRGVNFGEKAINDDRYFNRRAEMWDKAKMWLSGDLSVQIPEDETLLEDLTSVEKSFDSYGRLQLEKKDEVKKRIGRSPDKADAFCLTFAEPVLDYGKVSNVAGGTTFEDLFADAEKERRLSKW